MDRKALCFGESHVSEDQATSIFKVKEYGMYEINRNRWQTAPSSPKSQTHYFSVNLVAPGIEFGTSGLYFTVVTT
jgi:hypothetical protein